METLFPQLGCGGREVTWPGHFTWQWSVWKVTEYFSKSYKKRQTYQAFLTASRHDYRNILSEFLPPVLHTMQIETPANRNCTLLKSCGKNCHQSVWMPLTWPNFSPCSEADAEERLDPGGSSCSRFSGRTGCRNVTVPPPATGGSRLWTSCLSPSPRLPPVPPPCTASLQLPRRPFRVGCFRLLCPSDEAAIWEECFCFVFCCFVAFQGRQCAKTDVSHSGMKRKIQFF